MEAADPQSPNLDLLLDVPVQITVELGACQLPMGEVLQLVSGSVIQLDKLAESAVDIYVNQKRFGRGEVVVVEDHFGIKITEILKPS